MKSCGRSTARAGGGIAEQQGIADRVTLIEGTLAKRSASWRYVAGPALLM